MNKIFLSIPLLRKARNHDEHFFLSGEREIIKRIVHFTLWIGGLISAHTIAMIWLEELPLNDALWLSFTSISTVGYGDIYAKTNMGRAATVLLLYIGGITLMAQMASEYLDYRISKRERIRCGRWNWRMKNHILILNSPVYNSELYFKRIIGQIREHPDYQNTPIQILSSEFKNGLPVSLTAMGVKYYNGTANNFADLHNVNVSDAKHILVLAKNEYDIAVDSITFDIVHRLKELNLVDRTFVECVDDENRERLHNIGARVVLRPIRSYPEIVVRSMVAPGSEAILEDFFTYHGDHPQRYSVEIDGCTWSSMVCALASNDLGTLMGYVDSNDYVIPNPPADTLIKTKAIIVLVREISVPSSDEIRKCLGNIAAYNQTASIQLQSKAV